MMIRSHDSHRRPKLAAAFTLVELLVVLFLVLLLAAIALPNVREVLSDQLIARTARGVSTYIDVARNRAIAEGRQVGILIERGACRATRVIEPIRFVSVNWQTSRPIRATHPTRLRSFKPTAPKHTSTPATINSLH